MLTYPFGLTKDLKTMRFTIFLIATIILSSMSVQACEWAVQSRILPIAVIDNEIIALNIRMKRTWQAPDSSGDDNMWYWNGNASLVSFSPLNLKITKQYHTETFSWSHQDVENSINELYAGYLKMANKILGIKLLVPDEMEMYYFKGKPQLDFVVEKGDTAAYVTHNDLPVWKVPLPNWEYTDSSSILYYPNAKSAEEMSQLYEISHQPSITNAIGSIRSFKIGNNKLIILHVGSGDLISFDDGEELPLYGSAPTFDKLINCAYEEPVLWHGIGQDIPIWLN